MYEINTQRLIKTFTEIASISSPSWQEKKAAAYIEKRLKKNGIKPGRIKCGNSFSIYAEIPGNPDIKTVLFSSHMDTVVPCSKITPIRSANRITSDGTSVLGSDDKAAIAMFLEAVTVLKEKNIEHGPIELLFSCAEEVGLQGIKLFDMSLLKSKYAFVFDSGGPVGKIILRAPYHGTLAVTVHGKSAHAGMEPENGVNSITALASAIAMLPQGRIDNETTVNTGLISGGTATNIVPNLASCKIEIRSISEIKIKRLISKIKKTIDREVRKRGAAAEIIENLEYPGYKIHKEDEIAKIAGQALESIGIRPEYDSSGGGSDTNIFNSRGLKALNFSCGMMKVHTTEEFIEIHDLIKGTELTLALIELAPRKS